MLFFIIPCLQYISLASGHRDMRQLAAFLVPFPLPLPSSFNSLSPLPSFQVLILAHVCAYSVFPFTEVILYTVHLCSACFPFACPSPLPVGSQTPSHLQDIHPLVSFPFLFFAFIPCTHKECRMVLSLCVWFYSMYFPASIFLINA